MTKAWVHLFSAYSSECYLSGIKHKTHHKVDTEFKDNNLDQSQRNISNDSSNIKGRRVIQSEMLMLFENPTTLHESWKFGLSNQSVKQEREQERATTRELDARLVYWQATYQMIYLQHHWRLEASYKRQKPWWDPLRQHHHNEKQEHPYHRE